VSFSNTEGKREATMQKPAENQHPISEVLRARWSPRAFSSAPIARETLLSLLEAARWAPSCANEQPWHFLVVSRQDAEPFAALVGCLEGLNPAWAASAGVLLVGLVRTAFAQSGNPNRHAWYDLGQAVSALSVEATSRGLFMHQMAGFSAEKLRAAFSIPAGVEPVVVAALGAYGDASTLPEALRAREGARRTRNYLNEIASWGAWGRPVPGTEGI
jgi:nitroreductase